MLATVMLVFPPILSRLNLPTPPWLHPGELIAAVIAATLYLRAPARGRPFLALIGVLAFRIAADTIVGFAPAWIVVFTRLPLVWPPLLAIGAMTLAFGTLWSGWRPAWWVWRARPATAAGS